MPKFEYLVSIPEPTSHLIKIQLTVSDWRDEYLDWRLPVWSVGSYLVREYAKHIVEFSASCPAQKIAKNHWRLHSGANSFVEITYTLYANELTVRTNHVDATHAFFNGGAVFGYVDGCLSYPLTVEIVKPVAEWQIATALPRIENLPNSFFARDFHALADSPFEIGLHKCYAFTVLGKQHDLVVWGDGNIQPEQVLVDVQKIIATEASFWGGLPYDRYLFILHLSAGGYGGLEHRDCCVLLYDRYSFKGDKYIKFLNLVAHEFFHVWNVKRLRPASLFKINYDQENYTHSLWFCEGLTSYYDQLMVLRAGLCDCHEYLRQVSDSITRLQTTIGRKYQSLWDASFDAWIKLYRPDLNSHNCQVSYYLKGELVGMLLDLHIRIHSQHQSSLDRVMQFLWQKYGIAEQPYDDHEVLTLMEMISGVNLQEFWQKYLFGTAELDFNYYLQPFGLCLQAQATRSHPYTGLSFRAQGGSLFVKAVDVYSPAQRAGIDANDEVLAINHRKVTFDSIYDRLREYQAGASLQFTIFHQDELRSVLVTLAPPQADYFAITFMSGVSTDQTDHLHRWLGQSSK